MNKPFIDNIVDAYFIDNNIYETNEITKEYYVNELLNVLRELREEDFEFYEQIYNYSKLNQQQIIKNYLDLCFDTDIDIDENDDAVFESATIYGTAAAASLAYLIIRMMFPNRLTNFVFRLLDGFARKWQNATKFLSRLGGRTRVRYAVIQRNLERCYQDCGIQREDLKLSHYAATTRDIPWWGQLTTPEQEKIAKCLRDCYINHMIAAIDLYMKNYFECLDKAGVDITGAENDIMKFISRLGSEDVCRDFYKQAKNLFDEFQKILDIIYPPQHRRERQHFEKQLRETLYRTRRKVQS